jgi:hypothetical protein
VQGPGDPATATLYATTEHFEGVRIFDVISSGIVDLGTIAIPFEFEAALRTRPILLRTDLAIPHHPASGGMHLTFGDGSVRYIAIHSEIARDVNGNHVLTFVLLPYLESGELDLTKPVIATARPGSGSGGGILWDLEGSTLQQESIQFEVPGSIRVVSTVPEPPAPLSFSFHYPLQKVTLQGTGEVGIFSARGNVRQDHSVEGMVEIEALNGKGPVSLVPVFGKLDEPSPTAVGPSYTIVFVVEGAPLVSENVLVAVVRPNPAVPGCDIWDFSSGTVHLDARGVVTVVGTLSVS